MIFRAANPELKDIINLYEYWQEISENYVAGIQSSVWHRNTKHSRAMKASASVCYIHKTFYLAFLPDVKYHSHV